MDYEEKDIWEKPISLSIADKDEKLLLDKKATKKHFIETEVLQADFLSQEDRNLLLQTIEEWSQGDFGDFDDSDEEE